MPNYSDEQRKEHTELVRRYLVRMPKASVRELAKLTGFSQEYAWKLSKKIHGERAQRMAQQTVNIEVAKMEDVITELCRECWLTIQNKAVRMVKNDKGEVEEIKIEVSESDKLKAIEVLVKNMKTLFDVKMDAGIFNRKLGEITNFNVFLDLVKAATHVPTPESESPDAGTVTADPAALPAATE